MAIGTLRVGQWRGSPGQALKDMSGLGSEAIVRHSWKMADRAMSKSNNAQQSGEQNDAFRSSTTVVACQLPQAHADN